MGSECTPRTSSLCSWKIIAAVSVLIMLFSACGFVYMNYYGSENKNPSEAPQSNAPKVDADMSTENVQVFNEDDANFAKHLTTSLDSGKTVVVMLYHPSCHHCKGMRDAYESFAASESSNNVVALKMFPKDYMSVPSILGIPGETIRGVPSIILLKNTASKNRMKFMYSHSGSYASNGLQFRSPQSLSAFVSDCNERFAKEVDDFGTVVGKADDDFEPSQFQGQRSGFDFKHGPKGLGYYRLQEKSKEEKKKKKKKKKVNFELEKPKDSEEPVAAEDSMPLLEEDDDDAAENIADFIAAESWDGNKNGYEFKSGDQGVGYYRTNV